MSTLLDETIRRIVEPSPSLVAAASIHLDQLTKPLGSLGHLEDFAVQLVAVRGLQSHDARRATPLKRAAYVFAADHGIVAEGVSAYPSSVTQQMVLNFIAGGAAVNVLARLHHVHLHIVDVGVDADFDPDPLLLARKVRRGSRNMLYEAAMSPEELAAAIDVGVHIADEAAGRGETIVAVGEMGIGNTTAASAITSALTGKSVHLVTGRGTGLNDEAYARKCDILVRVLERYDVAQSSATFDKACVRAMKVLQSLGGLEIAAMTGMMLGAASHGLAVIADGFISTAAAACALALAPALRSYLFAGHQSEEPGHTVLLDHLGLVPVLRLNMRLGEGTGAILAMPILESALALYDEMATFASAGVDEAGS